MRKRYYALTALVFCLLWARHARADMIFEPEDSFYARHASACVYVNRVYTANGPDGKVILYKSPEVPEEVAVWENGFQAWISWVWEDGDGILWGIYEDYPNGSTGWMPMDYMEVVYDGISFREEHGDRITAQSGYLEGDYRGKEIYLWKYPGSGEQWAFTVSDYAPSYDSVYTDEAGNTWGHTGYYFGHRDVWICIEKPEAEFEELYPDGTGESGRDSAEPKAERRNEDSAGSGQETKRIVPKADHGAVIAAAVMVFGVTVATGALIVLFGRKRQDGDVRESN